MNELLMKINFSVKAGKCSFTMFVVEHFGPNGELSNKLVTNTRRTRADQISFKTKIGQVHFQVRTFALSAHNNIFGGLCSDLQFRVRFFECDLNPQVLPS